MSDVTSLQPCQLCGAEPFGPEDEIPFWRECEMDYYSEVGRLAAMIADEEDPMTRERLREQMRVLRRAKRNLQGRPMPCAGGPSAEALGEDRR